MLLRLKKVEIFSIHPGRRPLQDFSPWRRILYSITPLYHCFFVPLHFDLNGLPAEARKQLKNI
jgi:hypothetical protein